MRISEMSQEFDILYNQVNSNLASSVDEYEKSVFLTKAQDELIRAYFDPRGNKFIEGFDDGQLRQYDFSLLIENDDLIDITGSGVKQYDPRSRVYAMPKNLFLTLNESIYELVGTGNTKKKYLYQILPITYAAYQTLMQKPYQYPTKRSVWRIITGQGTGISYDKTNQNQQLNNNTHAQGVISGVSSYCEIIGRFKTDDIVYKMRYVKKPTPIILVNLDDETQDLTIDGYHGNASLAEEAGIAIDNGIEAGIPCYLPEGVHHRIVQRAVELASAVYNPQALNAIVSVGNASATELGVVPRQEGR